MPDVELLIDGQRIRAASSSLLIDVCKSVGIEIPSFCYYPGLALQGACRMCLVEIAKLPKLQTACTTRVAEGMVVTTDSDVVRQSRKAMLEFVLANHPLDCPVCDAGGQCELQDSTFRYGASESKLVDLKNHRDEEQWSPVVYFDRPRCIMCYRCVRICGEGMDVSALGIANRNSSQLIVPNKQDHLECEECGMCIDICPVGALTSGPYRYKARPWEMKHVATVCAHCGDGCTTTLGVRPLDGKLTILRGTNRDKSGINGDFLCVKGRYAFDFVDRPERLTGPLMRIDGELRPVSWGKALHEAARLLEGARESAGGIGVIGSNHTTNEENYLLQKFARTMLKTNNIDHRRTADFCTFFTALHEFGASTATMAEVATAPAMLLIGSDPTYKHPLLAWQIRNNVRLNGRKLYVINSREIKLCRQASQFIQIPPGWEGQAVRMLKDEGRNSRKADSPLGLDQLAELTQSLKHAGGVVIIFGAELTGTAIRDLVEFGCRFSNAKFICLGDGPNSRGAADMGLLPDRLPGYETGGERWEVFWQKEIPKTRGLNLYQMLQSVEAGTLPMLYVVGADPVGDGLIAAEELGKTRVLVQDIYLTETAAAADIVLPSASAYEKSGTFTNTCGDLQCLQRAADIPGVRSDLEIIAELALIVGHGLGDFAGDSPDVRAEFGESRGTQSGEVDQQAIWTTAQMAGRKVSVVDACSVLREIQRGLSGYISPHVGFTWHEGLSHASADAVGSDELIRPYEYDLFSSATYGDHSELLKSVLERRMTLPHEQVEER
jgi:NADH-quinone oxidoreductase subunit G